MKRLGSGVSKKDKEKWEEYNPSDSKISKD